MGSDCIKILATGHYLPSKVLTNEELCENIPELTSDWIIKKTGIKKRYHVTENDTASSMAVEAFNDLSSKYYIDKSDIDLVIVASFSQDYLFPPVSAKIHSLLGFKKECQIIDINTNCVGLVTALTIASERMMCDSSLGKALVIGVEVLSRFTNPKDKETAIFFSDGASAVVLGRSSESIGFKAATFLTDSSTYESVRMRGGGSSYPVSHNFNQLDDFKNMYIEQNGLATWKQAVTNFPLVIQMLLERQNLSITDIDFFIFHQANGFLIDYLMRKMKVPLTKTYTNVEELGNTGSASIGIALSEAFSKGLIKKGDSLVIAGVGAGFNFGACLFKI
jgi:3-oxoacyl-[acyl-carrier-protein] synthase III